MRELVAFNSYGVYVYKDFEDKAKKQRLFIDIPNSRGLMLGDGDEISSWPEFRENS